MKYALVTATIRGGTIECPYCGRRLPVQHPGPNQIRAACDSCETEFQVTDAIEDAEPLPNIMQQHMEKKLRSRGLAVTPENINMLLQESVENKVDQETHSELGIERTTGEIEENGWSAPKPRKPWWKFW